MGNPQRGRLRPSRFVDDGLSLDVSRLLQRFEMLPGKHVSSTLRWVTEHGSATAGYEASLLNPKRAWLRLSYTIAYVPSNKVAHQDYRIRLAVTRTHLGGLRWWFGCPITQLRTAKLYLPSTGVRFLSRRAYGRARPLRRGLLAHIRDHFTGTDRSGRSPAGQGHPELVAGRPGASVAGAMGTAPNSQRMRKIYAERLGRPLERARSLITQDSC
jgi:hypothetical protein